MVSSIYQSWPFMKNWHYTVLTLFNKEQIYSIHFLYNIRLIINKIYKFFLWKPVSRSIFLLCKLKQQSNIILHSGYLGYKDMKMIKSCNEVFKNWPDTLSGKLFKKIPLHVLILWWGGKWHWRRWLWYPSDHHPYAQYAQNGFGQD